MVRHIFKAPASPAPMRRLPTLVAALLLPAVQPLLVSAAANSAALLVAQAPAQAQSAEAVAQIAQAITVRMEGATQGSGVLVKREGNRYTVLTAWHVVSGQRAGEELDIYTPDGQRHSVETSSITQNSNLIPHCLICLAYNLRDSSACKAFSCS